MGIDFKNQMSERGWFVFPDFIGHNLIQRTLDDLEDAYAFCRKIQIRNGIANAEGTCHHLIGLGTSFMECLSEFEKIDSYLTEYFGGKYILNSLGGNILEKGKSYANDIHRDIRSFSGDQRLMLNALIMLDDFTNARGATWLMNGGHKHSEKPLEEDFKRDAFQITGSAGTLVVWNSNLWHRAGVNTTDHVRRSITPEFTKPFMKQGYDYCRALPNIESQSEYLKQVLGYNSRTPHTLHDWYRPRESRFYKGCQG